MSSPTPRSDLRVVIIEDHVLFAESLELALTIEGYQVRRVPVPTADQSPHALLAAAIRFRPRIVLLDLDPLGRLAPRAEVRAALGRVHLAQLAGAFGVVRADGQDQRPVRPLVEVHQPLRLQQVHAVCALTPALRPLVAPLSLASRPRSRAVRHVASFHALPPVKNLITSRRAGD